MIKSRFFWILSAILAVGILILITYNDSTVKIRPSYQTSSMQNLHLTHKESGNIKWELSAVKAILPTGNKQVLLESLALKVNRTPAIFLTGGSGVYEIEDGHVTLNDKVEVTIKDAKFVTDSANYDTKNELITTNDDIKFSGNNFLISGTGLAAKVKQQQVRIIKNVKATFYR